MYRPYVVLAIQRTATGIRNMREDYDEYCIPVFGTLLPMGTGNKYSCSFINVSVILHDSLPKVYGPCPLIPHTPHTHTLSPRVYVPLTHALSFLIGWGYQHILCCDVPRPPAPYSGMLHHRTTFPCPPS